MSEYVFKYMCLATLAVVIGCGIALRFTGNELFLYVLYVVGILSVCPLFLGSIGFFEVFKITGPTSDQRRRLMILSFVAFFMIIMAGNLRLNDDLKEISKALKKLDVPLSTLK